MKRLVSILTLTAFVGISALSAQTQPTTSAPNAEKSLPTALTNDEANFLFGEIAKNLNVEILSKKELDETNGEFWGAIVAAAGLVYGIGRDQKWW